MVRINLLGEKTDDNRTHAFQILGFGVSVVVTVVACFFLQVNSVQEVELLRADKEELERELESLKQITKEVADLETRKKQLKERVVTISNLKAKKQGPVRTLDDLNVAMPVRSWLTSIKEKSGAFEISGVALDNQTIADFMKTLEKSDYFGTVDLIQSTRTTIDGVKLQQFSLLAQLTNPKVKELPKGEASVVPASIKGEGGKSSAKPRGKKKFDI